MVSHGVSDTVNLGVVGLGGMGQRHSRNARDLGHEVVAGADVIEEMRREYEAKFGADTYADAEEMYEEADLDAVVITTPNKFHAPAATAALEHDLDVLCEKPLANSLENARSIAAAEADSAGFLMVGFHNRFSAGAEIFTEKREAGEFGDLTHIEANYLRRRGIPGLGSWFTNKDLSGGGSLIDIGVHAIDFALHLAGFPEVEEVSGVTRANFGTAEDYADPDGWAGNWDTSEGGFDVDDSVSAFVRCADDTTISLEVSWATNREPTNTFYARGTEAGAELDVGGEELTLYECGTGGTDHYADVDIAGDLDPDGHEAEDEYFLSHVAAGEEPERNTVEEGLAVQEVIDAIYRSADEGGAVDV
jgi:predicted dehydrogenase